MSLFWFVFLTYKSHSSVLIMYSRLKKGHYQVKKSRHCYIFGEEGVLDMVNNFVYLQAEKNLFKEQNISNLSMSTLYQKLTTIDAEVSTLSMHLYQTG